MRPTTFLISVFLHGALLGSAVVAGRWCVEAAAARPRVDVLAVEPRCAGDLPPARAETPPVAREEALPAAAMVDPEIEVRPFTPVDLVVDAAPLPRALPGRELLARVVPEAAAGEPEVASPPQEVTSTPVAVAGEEPRARVAACPVAENPPPDYPERERRLGHQGTVVVAATVDVDGAVLGVRLARSSGFGGLDRAATAAVRRWRFEPAKRGGVAEPDEALVEVVFRID